MRVLVRHGHFAFYPSQRDDILHFQRLYKLQLFAKEDYFTFEALKDLPRWSQIGRVFGNLPAITDYEGQNAWEVMSENGFVYSLALSLLVPVVSIFETLSIPQARDYAIAPKPLIQPGSILQNGQVLTGYNGFLDLNFQRLYIGAVETL